MDGIPNVLVDNATIVKVPERKRGRERETLNVILNLIFPYAYVAQYVIH